MPRSRVFLHSHPGSLSAGRRGSARSAIRFQLYFDFSGYSDMAIGMAKLFGFDFDANFDHPYLSASLTEFWRRWHISLGRWFRDYVYIPLGGSRVSTPKCIRNLLIVWVLTGLWHGASWTFVAWGLYHGILLLLEKYPAQRHPCKDALPDSPYSDAAGRHRRLGAVLLSDFPRRFSILGGCSVPGAARFGIPPQNTILQQTGSFLYSAFLAAAHGFGRFTGISCSRGAVLALCFLRCF
ncbi:MAG: MBOAT family O-acyltransferase [Acutalibacteraceae bacterium]